MVKVTPEEKQLNRVQTKLTLELSARLPKQLRTVSSHLLSSLILESLLV